MKKIALILLLSLGILACKKEEEKKEDPPQLTPPSWIIGKWTNTDNTVYEFKEHDFCKTFLGVGNFQCMAELYKDNDNINLDDESTDNYYKIYKLQNNDKVLIYEFVKISPNSMEEVKSSGNTMFTKVTN